MSAIEILMKRAIAINPQLAITKCKDWNHVYGRLQGKELMDWYFHEVQRVLRGEEYLRAQTSFERLITEEDKRKKRDSSEYYYPSIRGRWEEFKVTWCLATGLIKDAE